MVYSIICIDNDVLFLKSLEEIFLERIIKDNDFGKQGRQYDVKAISNAEEGIAVIKALAENHLPISLIISDQMLPRITGVDMLEEVKGLTPTTVRVLLTKYAGLESAIKAINNKVLDKYLLKPIADLDDFVLTIKHLLNEFHLREKVENQHNILYSHYVFTNKLNSLTTLQETLDQIVTYTKDILRCQRVSILLLEEDRLVIKSAIGLPNDIIRNTKIKIGTDISGRVFEKREALLIKDINEEPWLSNIINPDYISFMSVPIVSVCLGMHSQVLGVINATNKEEGEPFTEDDLTALSYIADSSSIAINNQINKYKLEENYFETIKALAMAIEANDPYTKGHSERVMQYSILLAKELNLPQKDIDIIGNAGILHDIGKIGISIEILNKKGKLTNQELQRVKEHPLIGANIVENVSFLKECVQIIKQHHERIDCTGYPKAMCGKEIELCAKIMAITDAFDAMTSDRPYRKKMRVDDAINELKREVDKQFDKECVEKFIACIEKGIIDKDVIDNRIS